MMLISLILNKIIIGAIIGAVIIIIAVGLFSVLEKPENLDIDDQSLNESSTPKKITLQLTDGINIGEGGQ